MSKAALALAEALPAEAMAAFDEVVQNMPKGETSDAIGDKPTADIIELVQPITDDTRAPLAVQQAKIKGPNQLAAGAFLIGMALGKSVKAIVTGVDNAIMWVGNTVRNAAHGMVSLIGAGAIEVIHATAYSIAFATVVVEVASKRGQRAGNKFIREASKA